MDQDATWYGGRPRRRRHCVRWGPISLPERACTAPNFRSMSIVAKRLQCIRIPLGTEVDLSLGDIVVDGKPAPPPLKGQSPRIFGQCPLWPNGWMTKMPLGMEVGLGPGDFVFDGTELPPPKRGTHQLSAHVYCGQTAGCIRIPLGTEVVLSPGDIVLDGDPAPPRLKRHSSPIFGPCPLWPNSWMQ